MTLQRWEPFRDLETVRDAMERFFEEKLGSIRGEGGEVGTYALPLDIWETPNEVKIQASVPGVRPEDLDIRVEGNVLTIRGQYQKERATEEENYVRRERRAGRFFRQATLPTTVQAEKAEATFDNGVVTITFPKAEQARGRQIPVRTTAGQVRGEERAA